MALTLGTAARNASVDARTALVNGGKIKLKASSTVLVTCNLAATAFLASSGGSATAKGGDGTNAIGAGNPLAANATNSGTADNYDVTTSADVVVWSGAVGSDMTIDNAVIASGQEVKITGWSHGQPA